MARSEDIRQITEGVYREKRAYLADHVFLTVPGAGQPTIDLLSGEQWGTLTDLPTDARSISKYYKLDLDPEAAPVVVRIFAEFIAGHGFYAIAEGLTRDDIPSPSAHDPERNKHRSGIAWNKFAVRAILVNPRYAGHQVWNKQRKDEVLIDIEDVSPDLTACGRLPTT